MRMPNRCCDWDYSQHIGRCNFRNISRSSIFTRFGTCPPVTILGTKPATESDTSLAVATRELNATEFGDWVNGRYWNRTSHVSFQGACACRHARCYLVRLRDAMWLPGYEIDLQSTDIRTWPDSSTHVWKSILQVVGAKLRFFLFAIQHRRHRMWVCQTHRLWHSHAVIILWSRLTHRHVSQWDVDARPDNTARTHAGKRFYWKIIMLWSSCDFDRHIVILSSSCEFDRHKDCDIVMLSSSCDLDRHIVMLSSSCEFDTARFDRNIVISSCDFDRHIVMLSQWDVD